MIGLKRTNVTIENYSLHWPEIYKVEEKLLLTFLKDYIICIEPVGSTSVPGLKSKPIIDIAIGVRDFVNIKKVKDLLISKGYEFRPFNGSEERYFFVKGPWIRRTHHLHIEIYGGPAWNDHIDFRNCLIESPSLCRGYEELKVRLARCYPDDRDAYTGEKADFIQLTLKEFRMKKQIISYNGG